MNVINLRKHPQYKDQAIAYFQQTWGSEASKPLYADCIARSLTTDSTLPIWYLLMDGSTIAGGVGLITNDFISNMDLWPWLAALYVEKNYRGNNYAQLLIDAVKTDAANAGFETLYLATDHVGYYEKFDFDYICDGYHPWGDVSRVYAYGTQNSGNISG